MNLNVSLLYFTGATDVSNLTLPLPLPITRPDQDSIQSPTASAELRIPASASRPVLQMPPLPPVNTA